MSNATINVKALYSFKGKNNDELSFKKGSIITITQIEEGGWWEGTLGDKTGWFPSNYVEEVKSVSNGPVSEEPLPNHRDLVIRHLSESEDAYTSQLEELLTSHLLPLRDSHIIAEADQPHLDAVCSALDEILVFQQSLAAELDACQRLPAKQKRPGGTLMVRAPQFIGLYETYADLHTSLVVALTANARAVNRFLETLPTATDTASIPQLPTVIRQLSLPFRRLENYPRLLKEVEQHTELSHADRGDTQRALAVYADLATLCRERRSQHELEHELLASTISGWQGKPLAQLGPLIRLGEVRLLRDSCEPADRLLLLVASGQLIVVNATTSATVGDSESTTSTFEYQERIHLSGVAAQRVPDSPPNVVNAFQLTGPMMQRTVVVCRRAAEQRHWMDDLRRHCSPPTTGPPPPPARPTPTAATPQVLPTKLPSPPPTTNGLTPPPAAAAARLSASRLGGAQQAISLRPCPPMRPVLSKSQQRAKRSESFYELLTAESLPRRNDKSSEDDSQLLAVVDAYCTSAKTRHTVNSVDLSKRPLPTAAAAGTVSYPQDDSKLTGLFSSMTRRHSKIAARSQSTKK